MRFRPNYTALPAFFVWAILQAQECRLIPITPSQPVPKVEEGERALASATFRSTVFAFALSPRNEPYFFDTVNRIRRVDASGRIVTVAGNGDRAETMEPGPALQTALPPVGQMAFSPSGVLHFSSAGRVMRVVEGRIEVVAGSGRPGFNLEEGLAADVNLGSIASIAFAHNGDLMLTDGYNRVRRLGSDGVLKTVAGSARIAAAAGRTGDDGPATEAALSSPREIFPFRDGSFWIKDLSGRHLRIVTPDGIIRTVNQNFVATVNLLALADGSPGAFTANLVYPVRANGTIETGARPFPAFTGTPLAVSNDGALYFLGNERPEQRNPLVRLHNGVQTVVAAAPSAPIIDGQAAPFGTWLARSGSLLYATTLENRTGIVELRP
ncbi:MAG: hypothetical protein JNL98_32520, partial [Bryobacterales bacterium]|nr:hypothetical protein [Bryobacterales bacterium]